MDDEHNALIDNEVWDVVAHPSALKKVVKSRCVITTKLGPTGLVEKYKSGIVAKGYSQIHGVDYDETFATVFQYKSIQILFAIVSTHPQACNTRHSDVKNGLLNGN